MESHQESRKTAAPRSMGPVEKWVRVIVYFLSLIPVFLYFEVTYRLWAMAWSWVEPAGRVRRRNLLTGQWGALCCDITQVVLRARAEVVGEIPEGRFVIVSNHQSTADISILFWVFRTRNLKFVTKRELKHFVPFISLAIRNGGFGIIERKGSRSDLKILRDMGRGLEHWDACAVLFAEGTRSRDGNVLPYLTAATRVVAQSSNLPLLPVAIDGTWVGATLPSFARSYPGASARITIGRPIPPEEYTGRFDAALQDIRTWTVDVIEGLRQEGVTPRPPGWEPGRTGSAEAPSEVETSAAAAEAG